jgi:hypothetical protein
MPMVARARVRGTLVELRVNVFRGVRIQCPLTPHTTPERSLSLRAQAALCARPLLESWPSSARAPKAS